MLANFVSPLRQQHLRLPSDLHRRYIAGDECHVQCRPEHSQSGQLEWLPTIRPLRADAARGPHSGDHISRGGQEVLFLEAHQPPGRDIERRTSGCRGHLGPARGPRTEHWLNAPQTIK